MTVSPFDHPVLSGLLGDEEIAGYFSFQSDLAAMLSFEASLARVTADAGFIPVEAVLPIQSALGRFSPDIARLRQSTEMDGVVVPGLVAQLRAAIGKPHDAHLHFGATSQDVIDTSLVMRLRSVCDIVDRRLRDVDGLFADLDSRFGRRSLMGRTRMQAAIPIKVGDRVEAWRAPLQRHRERLKRCSRELLTIQFGGAAGNLDKFGERALAVRAALADELGLNDAPQWHAQRDRLTEFAGILSMITGSLGKFGQDVALMAQSGDEIALAGGGASSAMPHKQNPVAAEILITLARFNAATVPAMHLAMVHEQERSGAAWSLEWLTLPQITLATGAALRMAQRLTKSIDSLGAD